MPGAQPFCWDALNAPVEELIEQPVSAEAGWCLWSTLRPDALCTWRAVNRELVWCAGAFKALRAALATLPLQQKRSCHKLAMLVPYRKRPQHLEEFLPRMHAYLMVGPPPAQDGPRGSQQLGSMRIGSWA